MTHDTDIVIAGSGLNGTALALALASGGFRVTLVDPTPPDMRVQTDFDGRAYALSLGSVRLLQTLQVWPGIAARAQPILDIRVSDGRPGEGASPLSLHFDHAEIEEGPMGHMVESRHLGPALQAALDTTPGIAQWTETRVVSHYADASGVTVTLDNGDTLTAALLIGCDGKDSPTARRERIRRIGWMYGQTALVAAIAHEKPHQGCAHQFFTPPGPLAILPLTGNRSSIVWTEATDGAAQIAALDGPAYLDVLRPRFGSFLGEISLAGARFSYPLRLSIATDFARPRVALVGDAAHAVHPIAGQGLNAGLKDVGTLAEVLTEARRRGEDIGRLDVLQRYQSWRRFDVATLAVATDAINRLFSNDNPALRAARDLGLAAVSALPRLRRGFIREAAGLTGDVPRLLKGQQL